MRQFLLRLTIASLTSLPASGQQTHFVKVQEGVQLEVIDWGGSGRPVVLLAGLGNTAHIFNPLAPKLTGFSHVYGITRRGFGVSSHPDSGYDEPRLAEDILQVLNALAIEKPVLIGHSMAGGEMTMLASQHPNRVSGLVYLDALSDVADLPASDPEYLKLARRAFPQSPEPPASRPPNPVVKAIGEGALPRHYSKIRVPVLSINDAQPAPGDYAPDDSSTAEERAAIDSYRVATTAFIDRWKKNLRDGPPSVRFLDLVGAGHYVFQTREAEVLGAIREFLTGLRR